MITPTVDKLTEEAQDEYAEIMEQAWDDLDKLMEQALSDLWANPENRKPEWRDK